MFRKTKNSRESGNFSVQRRRAALGFALRGAALSVLLVLALVAYAFGWGCPFLSLTGIPCPGCGLTRAWLAVLRLDFAEAFRLNFMFPAVPVLALFVLFDGKLFPRKGLNIFLLCLIALGFAVKFILGVFGIC